MSHTILEKIKAFEKLEKRRKYITGQKYYDTENEVIMRRRFMVAFSSKNSENKFDFRTMEDLYKANNKMPSSYLKLLVDQKVNYLLGHQPTYTQEDIKTDQQPDENIKIFYGRGFNRSLFETGNISSIKGLGWGHVFVENKILKVKPIEPNNTISEFDPAGNLITIIRYWKIDDGFMVEKWDAETVTIFKIENEKETIMSINRHITKTLKFDNIEVIETEQNSWGRVPFIPLRNNKNEIYDLQPIKPFIDGTDIVNSDFVNNLEDFQDVFWILTNYEGANLKTFLNEVKGSKVVKVGSGGSAKAETIEIPHEARKTFLDLAKQDIFNFGMGLNTDELSGSSLTNVVIKARYANLDLKVDGFQKMVEDFIDEYQFFVNRFIQIESLGNPLLVTPTFQRSQIVNEVELLDANVKQKGNVSDTTRFENHNWVDDVAQEFERIEEDNNRNGFDDGTVQEPIVNGGADNGTNN